MNIKKLPSSSFRAMLYAFASTCILSCTHGPVKIVKVTTTITNTVIDSVPDSIAIYLLDTVVLRSDSNLVWSKEIWPLDSSFSISILEVGHKRYVRLLYPQNVPKSGADNIELSEQIDPGMGWEQIYYSIIIDRSPGYAGYIPITTRKTPDDLVKIEMDRVTTTTVAKLIFFVDTSVNISGIEYFP